MDNPFDFRLSKPEDENAWQMRKFAPIDKTSSSLGGTAIYLVLALALGLVVGIIVNRRLFRKQKSVHDDKLWIRLHEVCVAKGLSAEEERVLAASLQAVGARKPDEAVRAEGYFNAIVAPDLSRRTGDKFCMRIRKKLFGAPEEKRQEFGGTRDLGSGDKVRLHFEGQNGNFPCTVINVADNGFVVTLPAANEKRVRPRKGDKVEGFIENGTSLCSFATHVEETFFGGVFACRLAHARELEKVHERKDTRVKLSHPVIFGHFPGAGVTGNQVAIGVIEDHLVARWEGTIRDMSMGGCCIATPAAHNFAVGDFVQFTTRFLPDEPGQTVLATIVHVAPVPAAEGGGRMLHLQFLGLDDDAESSLTRTVLALKRENEKDLARILGQDVV